MVENSEEPQKSIRSEDYRIEDDEIIKNEQNDKLTTERNEKEEDDLIIPFELKEEALENVQGNEDHEIAIY